MDWRDRIMFDPGVLTGKPVVKGTRLSVEFIVGLMSQGWSDEEVTRNYPGLSKEDIQACLAYASDVLSTERVFPLAI